MQLASLAMLDDTFSVIFKHCVLTFTNVSLKKSAEEYFNHYGYQILYIEQTCYKRDEKKFPLSFFQCPFKCICYVCVAEENEGIPISNPNLHPSVASVRKDIPIFLLNSIQKDLNTHKKLVVFLLHFRINIFCKAFFAQQSQAVEKGLFSKIKQ